MAFTSDDPFAAEVDNLITGSDINQHKSYDLKIFSNEFAKFLPEVIIDSHVHLWEPEVFSIPIDPSRYKITMLELFDGFSSHTLEFTYNQLLPNLSVRSVVFGLAAYEVDAQKVNRFVLKEDIDIAARLLIPPASSNIGYLEPAIESGNFAGLKPYPERIIGKSVYDVDVDEVVTEDQWKVANKLKLAIVLHLPRRDRLADRRNVDVLKRRLDDHPDAKLVLAHLGATACIDGLSESFAQLNGYNNLFFDTAMVSNEDMIQLVLENFGSSHLLFGTDLPFALVRGRRNCVKGVTRIITQEEYNFSVSDAMRHTYMLYNIILAIKNVLSRGKYDQEDIYRIFVGNSKRVFNIA